jgi:hypothetical protein
VVIYPTPRRLDEPPKLLGFSFAQWAVTLAAASGVYSATKLLGLPGKVTFTLLAFLVGTPALSLALAETGGPRLGDLSSDALCYVSRGRVLLHAGTGRRTVGVLIDAGQAGPVDELAVAVQPALEIPWD